MSEERLGELARNLRAVQDRIATACAAAGREPEEITLVVVTKFFPASDVLLLHVLGVHDVGENRDQEAGPKFATVREALGGGAGPDIRLHFVGRLQSNKARHVAGYADVVHSVDRPKLLRPLADGASDRGARLAVLIQVSLDGDVERGGVVADDIAALAEAVETHESLTLRGLMAVAPLGADPDACFAGLRSLSEDLRTRHPDATWISAGMSGDLEQAVRHGATHLRVGTAILGSRVSLL